MVAVGVRVENRATEKAVGELFLLSRGGHVRTRSDTSSSIACIGIWPNAVAIPLSSTNTVGRPQTAHASHASTTTEQHRGVTRCADIGLLVQCPTSLSRDRQILPCSSKRCVIIVVRQATTRKGSAVEQRSVSWKEDVVETEIEGSGEGLTESDEGSAGANGRAK